MLPVSLSSPNGAGLLQWPLFGQDQEFMELDLTPSVTQNIRKEHIIFMTVNLLKKLAKAAPLGRYLSFASEE